jgi:predicted ATPase
VVFVPLAGVTRPEQVLGGIARAVGADLGWTGSPLEALAERLGDERWLLLLDNLEQVLEAARDLDQLLARCPGVALLATSRTALGCGPNASGRSRRCGSPPIPRPAGRPAGLVAGGGPVRGPGPGGPS